MEKETLLDEKNKTFNNVSIKIGEKQHGVILELKC